MTTYTHRYLARIVVQAETPLAVGSGERDVLTNQLIATDVNGLPYIPGTALAGVLRHTLEQDGNTEVNLIMGFQGEKKENGNDEGLGSRLILSHAQMVGKEGIPIDGITDIDWKDSFYEPFQTLPVRQHVRISHRGAAEDKGKFDEQVIYKGTRFCFELELVSDGKDETTWNKMLNLFNSPYFRIGGGTRKGFGELSVQESKSISLDLSQPEKLDLFLNKTSELNDSFWNSFSDSKNASGQSTDWVKYELHLKPDDFFLFSSGLESSDAKMIPVTEMTIKWDNPQRPEFTKEQILIPATSVKGALAHRVAFHYNQLRKVYAETLTEELLEKEGYQMTIDVKPEQNKLIEIATKGNPAVLSLFGYSAKGDEGMRGNVFFSDLFKGEVNVAKKKILNHVSIDRFTGGAMDGALFNEEVIYKEDDTYNYILTMQVHKDVLKGDVEKAFDLTLIDLSSGMLPLGGGTMRGHGCFTGTIIKD
jgi:CRISPR/Cas system CSM-associated protein Csm3 (group 7 of RAMP superfamily)